MCLLQVCQDSSNGNAWICPQMWGFELFFAPNNSYIIQNKSGWKGPQEGSSPTSYSEQSPVGSGQANALPTGSDSIAYLLPPVLKVG